MSAVEPSAAVPSDDDVRQRSGHEYGVLFWVGAIIGWAAIAYGTILLIGDDEASWFNTARLVAIGLVAHDGAWLAASVGTGWLLSRWIGREIPFWIRWGGWTSAIVVALWWPVGRRYGDALGNDTILPRDYTQSIIVLLVVIWVAAAAYGLWGWRRDRRSDG